MDLALYDIVLRLVFAWICIWIALLLWYIRAGR